MTRRTTYVVVLFLLAGCGSPVVRTTVNGGPVGSGPTPQVAAPTTEPVKTKPTISPGPEGTVASRLPPTTLPGQPRETAPPPSIPAETVPLPTGPLVASLRGITFESNGEETPRTIGKFVLPAGTTYNGGSAVSPGDRYLFSIYRFQTGVTAVLLVEMIKGKSLQTFVQTLKVLDVAEVTLSKGDEVLFQSDCQVDAKRDRPVVAVTTFGASAGDRQARLAWLPDLAAGTLVSIEAKRVLCTQPQG